MNRTLIGILIYIVSQLVIGFIVSRKVRNEKDYLLAGRRLGYGLATFSIFATWFGAETCIGSAGAVYEEGITGATSDPFGYVTAIFLMGILLAIPLWKKGLTTLPDLFRQRYSPVVERLVSLIIIPASLFWAVAQIRAFGHVLSASSQLDIEFATLLAALVVMAYMIMGGLLADAITDLVQGIFLIAGLLLTFFSLMHHPEFLNLMGGHHLGEILPLFTGTNHSWLERIEAWSIPVLGSVLAQELVSRVIASKSPAVARRSSLIAGCAYLAIGLIPVMIGLVGAKLIPGLQDPEEILPLMAQKFLSPLLFTLFAGALVSAILSTVDSALLSSGGLTAHNLCLSLFPSIDEKRKLRLTRLAVFASGVIAYALAKQGESVYGLVEAASAFGGAGVFVVVLFALFTRWGSKVSAYAALGSSVIIQIGGEYLFSIPYPFVTSLVVSVFIYLATIWIRPAPVTSTMDVI